MYEIELEGTTKKGEKYNASGIYNPNDNTLTILKDSEWAPSIASGNSGCYKQIKTFRDEIIKRGIVDIAKNKFADNYIRKGEMGGTPISSTAKIICGTGQSTDSWRIKGNNSEKLLDRLEKDGIVVKVGKNRQWIEPGKRKALSNAAGSMPALPEEPEQTTSANVPRENKESPNEKISKKIEEEGYLRQNVIFYGVPGCGKSHRINALLHLDDKVNGLEKEYYKRILFHPEYSYSDFVGQLRPEVGDDNKITYKFVPGAFTEILRDAYKDREHNYFLIIEEINRGNAPRFSAICSNCWIERTE